MVEADRLTLAFAAAADRAGADLANYVEAVAPIARGRTHRRHARLRDALTGDDALDQRRVTLSTLPAARPATVMRAVRRRTPLAAAQGDEPRDVEAGERHRARRADRRTDRC